MSSFGSKSCVDMVLRRDVFGMDGADEDNSCERCAELDKG